MMMMYIHACDKEWLGYIGMWRLIFIQPWLKVETVVQVLNVAS
jgi:hypothetical protein